MYTESGWFLISDYVSNFFFLKMDLKQFQTLYNFRQRSEEELSVLKDQLKKHHDRDRSRSRSSSSSSSSSSSTSSWSSNSSSSNSRSLPYSLSPTRGNLSSEDDNADDVIDAMLEERLDNCRKRRSSSGYNYGKRKWTRKLSRSRSPSPHFKYKRTVLISGLSSRATAKDVQDFFSQAGKIKRTKLCFNVKTLEFKNSAFVEYDNAECVLLALALNGKKYKGSPVVVQPSHREDQETLNQNESQRTVQVEISGFPSKEMIEQNLEIIQLDAEARVAKVNFDNLQKAFTTCHELGLQGSKSETLRFLVLKEL